MPRRSSHNKRLREASNRLSAAICPSGLTYRPVWYNTMGLDERSNVIVIYVLKPRLAYKALQSILSPDKRWEGFPVIVKKMGSIRLCKEEEKPEPAKAEPEPPREEREFGAGLDD